MGLSQKSEVASGQFLVTSAGSLYIQFGIQLALGMVLGLAYSPDPSRAFAAADSAGVLRAVHYWGSALLILHASIHLLLMIWHGWFRSPHRVHFYGGIGMLLLAMGFQLSGNVLPYDRHGVQTTVIEAGIASRAPVIGDRVREQLLAGPEFSAATLTRWYQAHAFGIPAAIILMLVLGFLVQRKGAESKENRLVMLIPVVASVLLAFGLGHPTSPMATGIDANRFHAHAGWYTWPMHGLLTLTDKFIPNGGWIGAMAVPGIAMGALLLMPLWAAKLHRRTVQAGVLIAVLLITGVSVGFGSQFAPLVGDRDPEHGAVATRPLVSPKSKPSAEPIADKPNQAKPAEPEVPTPPAQDAALAAKGKALFADQDCQGCHGKDGLVGKSGPSLKLTYQEHPEADFYTRYIKNPRTVDSGSTMPAFSDLKDDQLKALAEFLRFARK